MGFSAIDGAALGFECVVVEDLSRAVALPGTVERTNDCFTDAQVQRTSSKEIA